MAEAQKQLLVDFSLERFISKYIESEGVLYAGRTYER